MEKPEGFDEVVANIDKSYKEPGNSSIQELVLKQSINYLLRQRHVSHWFCKPYMYPISIHALILFSFPNNPTLGQLQPYMAKSLTGCGECVASFARGKSELKLNFAINKQVKVDKVNQFLQTILKWEMSVFNTEVGVVAIYWCLYNPEVFRQDLIWIGKFDTLVSNTIFTPNKLLPGMIYLLFEGNPQQKQLVNTWLTNLRNNSYVLTKSTLEPTIIQEFTIHLYQIQNSKYYNDTRAILFWTNFNQLIDFIDDEAFILHFNTPRDIRIMSEFTELRLYPIIRLLLNSLLSYLQQPLSILLTVFNKLLSRLKQKFWSSAVPIQSIQVLDSILSNPEFTKQLSNSESTTSITSWMFSILPSLGQLPRQSTCIRMGTFLLNQPDIKIRQLGCEILLSQLELSEYTSLSLMSGRDLRNAVDNQADKIVELALLESEISPAIQLIVTCMKFDLSILVHNTKLLSTKDASTPTIFDIFPLLWESLISHKIYSSSALTKQLMSGLNLGIQTTVFAPTKHSLQLDKQTLECKTQHNETIKKMSHFINQIFEKLTLLDPHTIKQIIHDQPCSIAIWGCIFTPQLTQSILDLLNDDPEGGARFETIQIILAQDLPTSLTSITTNLSVLTQLKLYEPSPKAVRILMDIINALINPVKTTILTSESIDQILPFWHEIWNFLIMIYNETFIWANQFHLQELVEFTRDTLDLSHLILDSYPVICEIANRDISRVLFDDFMHGFHSMLAWLRLGDVSLLNACVELVFKGFQLASEYDFTIDEKFIEMFIRFGAKAKKFNNKLSDIQRQRILSKAREFNSELVDQIVDEELVRHKKVIDLSESSKSPEPSSSSRRSITPRQQTLSRFGVVTHEPPTAPPPKDYKPTNLEAIRKELKSSRTSASPMPVIPPAAPRPAGFNSKKVAVGRSLNALKKKKHDSDSSSEEDDDESDSDISDLFIDKIKKKPKVTEVDMNLNPVHKSLRKTPIDPVKLEQERMRLRLNVNLKPLYNTILRWKYNSNHEYPSEEDHQKYTPVKDTYTDVKDYVSTTEPLLMLECWQGIQQAKNTGVETPFEMLIGTRTSIDGFSDVFASVEKKLIQDLKIGDSDLLVLGPAEPQQSPRDVRNYLKSETALTCLAKVREIKYNNNSDFCDITVRVYPVGSMMGKLLPNSVVVGMKVMQMITVEREFSSLRGLQYYDLLPQIIAARPNEPMPVDPMEARQISDKLHLNVSQAKAILGTCTSDRGFSLIQGPPGTGKTKTILGIVGYSLSQKQNAKSLDIPGESGSKNKILICAPSNAAVDELVIRLKQGVVNSSGEDMDVKVVRLGRSDAINAAVRDLTLEELVDKELQTKDQTKFVIDPTLRQQHRKCIEERDTLRNKLISENLSDKETNEVETQLHQVNKRRSELAKKLDEQREQASIAYRTKEIDRRNVQAKILNSAQIICSTLSGSAHDFLANLSIKFDKVIIDEACQCVELSAIIPLRYGCKSCIMVGDPNQLPPTVLSQAAASYNYEQSLFVRMQNQYPNSVYLLDVQYRMHPEISQFPSREFYKSKLTDGEGMFDKNKRLWHDQNMLTPYRFFDILSKHERNEQSRSLFNLEESKVALELVEQLMMILPQDKFRGRIGIISPYKEQIKNIKQVFVKKYGKLILDEIDFNTVDGFQGQEKEIIIMSCVRAGPSGNVGFLSDVRRMNVALTRARTTLWILGNKNSLSRNSVWKRLLEDADARNCVSKAYPGFLKSTEKRPRIEEEPQQLKKKKLKSPPSENHTPGATTVKPSHETAAKPHGSTTVHAIRSGIFNNAPKVVKHKPSKSDLIAAAHKLMQEKNQKKNNSESASPIPTNSGVINRTGPTPTSSGTINPAPSSSGTLVPPPSSTSTVKPLPSSSGTIKPPPRRPSGSIFIQRKRPTAPKRK
ncbi:Helicase SEN1 [Spathaspora sp. JA1]|nr:Helicase SEN1 [Spathaspora sp. JA1]